MRIRKLTLILFWIFFSWRVFADESQSAPALYLREGQRYPIEGIIAQNAEISPEGIATVHQGGEGTLLVGKKTGEALLTLESDGKKIPIKVVVRPSVKTGGSAPWDQTLSEIHKLPGVKISSLGGKTLIQGEILGRNAYQRILFHLKNFPNQLLVLALPGPGIKLSLLEQAQSVLANRGLQNVRVSNAGNRFFLEGAVATPQEVEQAFEAAQAVIPNLENHLAIPIRIDPTISVRVFLLELSRQAHLALGLSWPTGIQNIFAFSPPATLFSANWFAHLHHLSSNGQAKILAEPMLAVKSGSEAELSAGGEIPLKITGRFENKVVWKHYGLKVKIHIGGVAGKYIRTKIETESSHLDEATAVDGVPGIKTNRMSTEVDAIEGQPILLTGLFHASTSKDIEKVPGLGSLPLIGELFKSRRYRNHDSELLVALLPQFGATKTTLPLQSAQGLAFDQKWKVFE